MAKDCGTCGGKRLTWAAATYQTETRRRSDIGEHLPTLKRLVTHTGHRLDGPVTVIELGVRSGVSTSAWLAGLEATGGHLWTVDVNDAPPPVAGHKMVTHVKGRSVDPDTLARLPDAAHIVFVDTDHTYADTVAEIAAYAPRVVPGGAMVFHDTAVARFPHHGPGEPPFPVRTAVTEWLATGAAVCETEHTNCNGLMIVTVPGG